PRTLGQFEGLDVKANVGRFGPYVQLGKSFVSIPKDEDPMSISLDRAIELILAKREEDSKKLIKSFPEDESVQLLNGRYGAFLKIGKNNYKLPKDSDPASLSLEECYAIAEKQGVTKKRGRK
ncbi:MAG: DNA topoisomerase I, partial [Bacteroidetes bacterium]